MAGGPSRATLAEIREALGRPGVTQMALAEALGVRRATVSMWANDDDARPRLAREALARAVATLTGKAARRDPDLDPRSYVAGLFVELEDDARRILSRLDEARGALGLTARSPSADGTRGRAALRVAETAPPYGAAAPRKGRRG